jgi:hypothetical protein
MEVIFKSYMLSGVGGDDSPKQRFEKIINSVRWPSHITRLPKNVCILVFLLAEDLTPFTARRKSIFEKSR